MSASFTRFAPERDGMRAARAVGAFLHGAYCAGLAAKLVGTGYSVTCTYNGGEDGMLWEVKYQDGAVTADPNAAGGWVNRVDALEVAVSLAEMATVGFGGSADPCDCGTVRGASGLYVHHAAGGHADCTGTDAIVAARELARLLGTDVDVTDAARQSEAVRVLEWATEFASDCMWGDVDADDIAGMDADTIIRSAARHYDGGIMAMVNDALALPFALRVADAHVRQSGRLVNQLQRDAVAARIADDAAGELLERIATRSYAGTRPFAPEVWRDVADDAEDILQDCSALVAARIVRELPTVALRIMTSVPIDVNRAELVNATITERELRERADAMRGRGDDWRDVSERIIAAADVVAGIAKTARGHMLVNEGHYFASAYNAACRCD